MVTVSPEVMDRITRLERLIVTTIGVSFVSISSSPDIEKKTAAGLDALKLRQRFEKDWNSLLDDILDGLED